MFIKNRRSFSLFFWLYCMVTQSIYVIKAHFWMHIIECLSKKLFCKHEAHSTLQLDADGHGPKAAEGG
jgi:hypothetical protein